jgi:hypothetical protein
VSATTAGLPVVPGAWWSAAERRFECDLSGCARTGPHPAVRTDPPGELPDVGEGLSAHAIRRPEAVAARWCQQPYAVLVPTGEACDVVDVPARLGRTLAARLDVGSGLGPVIAAGTRWFFLTAPGGQLSSLGGDVLVHGHGSWIMLPPSLGPGGERAGWLARPAGADWALPSRDGVIAVLTTLTAPPNLATSAIPAPRSTRQPSATSRNR